eukprot:359468-Chlamydomonas_euryale.AAC.2
MDARPGLVNFGHAIDLAQPPLAENGCQARLGHALTLSTSLSLLKQNHFASPPSSATQMLPTCMACALFANLSSHSLRLICQPVGSQLASNNVCNGPRSASRERDKTALLGTPYQPSPSPSTQTPKRPHLRCVAHAALPIVVACAAGQCKCLHLLPAPSSVRPHLHCVAHAALPVVVARAAGQRQRPLAVLRSLDALCHHVLVLECLQVVGGAAQQGLGLAAKDIGPHLAGEGRSKAGAFGGKEGESDGSGAIAKQVWEGGGRVATMEGVFAAAGHCLGHAICMLGSEMLARGMFAHAGEGFPRQHRMSLSIPDPIH